MMAGPGFSISELIVAVKTFNDVRNSFTDRYTNSFTQIKKLANHIDSFSQLLERHEAILKSQGDSYPEQKSFADTLEECRAFIDGYKILLTESRSNPATWIRTAKFTFEKVNIARLQNEIMMEMQKVNWFLSLNNMVRENARQSVSDPQNVSNLVPKPGPGASNVEEPSSLWAAQRPEPQNSIGNLSNLNRSGSNSSWTLPITESPRMSNLPQPKNSISNRFGALERPQTKTTNSFQAPDIENPKDNQPFCNVRMKSLKAPIRLNKMPVIEMHEKGWDIVLYTPKKQKATYRHTVFKPYQQTSHPYSFHKNNLKPGEDSLGVEIMYYNQREQDQQVSVLPKANATSNEPAIKHFIASPKYVFSDTQLFKDFQSLLYGKTLFKYFDIDHIMTSLSRTANLSSTEQLKVWKSYPSSERGGSSLSFYANNEDDSRHLEFPIQWFGEKADLTNQRVTLNFAQHIVSPPKDIPPKPKRSSTQKTDSTNATSRASSIFSSNRRNTMASDVTDLSEISMLSAQSYTSRSSVSTSTSQRRAPTFLERAKSFQCLKINFLTPADATTFRDLFVQLWKEDSAPNPAGSPFNFGWNSPSYSTPPNLSPPLQSSEVSPYLLTTAQSPSPGTSPTTRSPLI